MIFPGDIFLNPKKIKSEYFLHIGGIVLLVNILVYLIFTVPEYINDKKVVKLLNQNKNLKVQMLQNMYIQTLDPIFLKNTGQYTNETQTQTLEDPKTDLSFLKDKIFWARAQKFPFYGDAVEIEKNKIIISEIKNLYQNSNQYKFGLGPQATTPWAWLTYQFIHAGFFHLLTNMIFLILITNILISRVSYQWILSVYVLGGIGAGVGYLFFSTNNEISMVGASGSVCALISFLSFIQAQKNIQWSYFLSPMPSGYGIIYMPAYLLFPVYLVSDFTAVLYHSTGVGQAVAHSAHIGGALTGFFLAIVYILWSKASAHRIFSDYNGLHKLF